MICVIAKLTPDATERLNILRKAVVSKKPPVKQCHSNNDSDLRKEEQTTGQKVASSSFSTN